LETPRMSESVVYGRHPVLELLKSEGRVVTRIVIAEGTKGPQLDEARRLAGRAHVEVARGGKDELDRLSSGANHQGIVALCAQRSFSTMDEIVALAAARKEAPLLVLADGIEDPGNLGAILRSAEAAGCHGVVISRHRAAGLTPAAVKASAGASEHILIAEVANVAAVAERLKRDHGIWIAGAAETGDLRYDRGDYTMPTAFAIGGEGKGLRPLLRQRCDYVVSIPMAGKVSSLNASAATAVLLFEARRQRLGVAK